MGKKEKIIFLGDSITDAGHNFQPAAEGERRLGNGYVFEIARMMGKNRAADIRNAGHDGFTVQGVLRMLEYDCLRHKPDLVSILVGCNDAAVYMNTGKTLKEQRFAENYRLLLRRVREETDARIISMGPFIFPKPLEYVNWIPVIREIEGTQMEIAGESGALFIPLQDVMNRAVKDAGYDRITADGIHLTREGARILAETWIREVIEK